MQDLRTDSNTISVWHIVDDHGNKDRIIAALAATRQQATNFDYFLLEEHYIREINIRIVETQGNSPDNGINSWHRDLVELSAEKLMALAKVIQQHAQIERILDKDISHFLAQAMLAGRFDAKKINLTSAVLAKIIKGIGDQQLEPT